MPDGRRHKLVLKNRHGNDDVREPAILEWIGEISANDFWLYTCAGWNGELGPQGQWEKPSPFESAKARALVCCPSYAPFALDWKACTENIDRLMALKMKPNSRIALSLLCDEDIKIRHAIFEV
jgi:hypothetical protein